jgi:YQGE family putative transporter
LARLTFWLPYHVDMAEYTDKKNRGKEMSLMWSTRTIIDIVIPILSGFIIFKFGFSRIFFAAIFIYLLAIVPYMALPDKEEKYSWGIRKTFREFFSKKMRTLVLANMANGAENSVGVVIWPIFIWKVLEGNYFELGAISSLIVLMTVILQLFAGRYADIFNKRKLLEMGSLFYAFGWLAKIFVLTAGQIFVVGTYHSFALILKDTPFETLNYEILADQGHLVDEYTVVKEMAIHAGKVSILFFAIAIAFSCGLQWTFVLAAIATLLVNIL